MSLSSAQRTGPTCSTRRSCGPAASTSSSTLASTARPPPSSRRALRALHSLQTILCLHALCNSGRLVASDVWAGVCSAAVRVAAGGLTVAAAVQVLQALTRKFTLAADVDMAELAARLPPQATGADVYGAAADAWMHALRRTIAELTASGIISAESDEARDLDDVDVTVCMRDFEAALDKMLPSLTEADLARYDKLQAQYAPGTSAAAHAGAAGAYWASDTDADMPGLSQERGGHTRASASNGAVNGGSASDGKAPMGLAKLAKRKKQSKAAANGSAAGTSSAHNEDDFDADALD
jgi:hypothetical protein